MSEEFWEAKSQTTLLQNTLYVTEGMILSIKDQFCSKKLAIMTTSHDIKTSCVLISSK